MGERSSSIMYSRSRSTTATERPLSRIVAATAEATVLLPAAIGPLMTNSLLRPVTLLCSPAKTVGGPTFHQHRPR